MVTIGFVSPEVFAVSTELNGRGTTDVIGGQTSPLDPENPEQPTNPGETHATEGPLRIDYVSSLDFGKVEIKKKDRVYDALAQNFISNTEPRASYIQITDQRTVSTGWTLQVRQETQFIATETQQELTGAVLSLDKGWANSSGNSRPPTVTRETIALNAIGSVYDVANANQGTGQGVWTIAFGASENNEYNQEPTIYPLRNSLGKAVIDERYNKPAYGNSAITLTIPNVTEIQSSQYKTEITWLLTELP